MKSSLRWLGAALLLLCGQAEAQTGVDLAGGRPSEVIRFFAASRLEGEPLIVSASNWRIRDKDLLLLLKSVRFTVFGSDGRELPVTFRPVISSFFSGTRVRRWSWFSLDHLPAGMYKIEINYCLRGIEGEHSAETNLEICGADDLPNTRDVSQIRAEAEVELLADMAALPQAEMRALELLRSHPELPNPVCLDLSFVYWEVGLLDRALFFMNEYLLFHRDAHNTGANPAPTIYSDLVQECGLAEFKEEGYDLFYSRVDDILASRVQSRLTPEMLTPVLGGDLLAARAEEEFARRNRFLLLLVVLSSFLAGMAAAAFGARLAAVWLGLGSRRNE